MTAGSPSTASRRPLFCLPPRQIEAARKEASLLKKLEHPCITRHVETFQHGGHLCIVMEYCAGGDVTEFMAQRKHLVSEQRILGWLVQLALALLFVHKRKVIHRDLKLQNLFLASDGTLRLGDFGISRVLEHTYQQAQTVTGTPYYLPPELCESKPYSYKADMWSLGCCLYEMCTARHPFEGENMSQLIMAILRGTTHPVPEYYSPALRKLIFTLLSRNPSKRPSAGAILQLPFIQPALEKYVRKCYRAGIEVPHVTLADQIPPATAVTPIDSPVTEAQPSVLPAPAAQARAVHPLSVAAAQARARHHRAAGAGPTGPTAAAYNPSRYAPSLAAGYAGPASDLPHIEPPQLASPPGPAARRSEAPFPTAELDEADMSGDSVCA